MLGTVGGASSYYSPDEWLGEEELCERRQGPDLGGHVIAVELEIHEALYALRVVSETILPVRLSSTDRQIDSEAVRE